MIYGRATSRPDFVLGGDGVKRVAKCNKCKIELNSDVIRYKTSSGYRCDSCYKAIEKNNKEWSEIYDYLVEKYFIKVLPTTIIKELKEMRKNFEYNIMLGCFKSMENSLIKYYSEKDFQSDYQRCRYIMGAFNKEIDNFYRKQLKKAKESEEIKQIAEFKVYRNKNTQIKSVNYDILD